MALDQGAFSASRLFDHDPVETAEEIERCGADVLAWLGELAVAPDRTLIDIHLVRSIHRRWFDTTFPIAAGVERTGIVLNRKGTALPVDALIPAVHNACDNWEWRFENVTEGLPVDEQIEHVVSEANALAVQIYDAHPFVDGNTRATFHLRNYALMLGGVDPILRLHDEDAHKSAWMAADPSDHAELDEVVLETLLRQGLDA